MSQVVDGPNPEDEPEGDESTVPADELAYDRAARKWYDAFRTFVYEQLPPIGATEPGKLGAATCEVPDDVAAARNRALIATLAAMEMMARTYAPEDRPFAPDTSQFGRDG